MDDWNLKPAADLGLPVSERLRSERREPGLVESAGHLFRWGLMRAFLRFYHRIEVSGRDNIPKHPPFVMVSNHTSHLDALVLASALSGNLQDRVFPIAAGDAFFETPALAAFATFLLNALPMWRQRGRAHSLEVLRERLTADACAYILFPEGTRSREGRISSFKAGLGLLIAGTGVPVVPCYLDGTFQALPPGSQFPRPTKIQLRIGTALSFSRVKNQRDGWNEIAATTEIAVRKLGEFRVARDGMKW